eukprot:s958_g23.t1
MFLHVFPLLPIGHRPQLPTLGAMERLRSFSSKGAKSAATGGASASSKLTPEQLKKQSTAKVRGLQHRHGELMKSLQEILKDVQSDSSWETLKDVQSGSATTEVPTPVPLVPAPVAPVTLWRPEDSKVKVMAMDGPAAKLNSRLRFHDIQAKSPPNSTFLCQSGPDGSEDRPAGSGYTPVKVPGIAYPVGGPRNFPGAEAAEPRPNRVEEIRRRAAEIESLRAQPAAVAPVAPVAPVPVVAMENPLRQVGPAVPPGAPEGADFFKVDTSKSPISDVWARYQAQGAGGAEDLRFDRVDGPVQSNGDGDLLQEPLAVTAVAPFPQLQPLSVVPPPQLTAPAHLGFCQAPQVGSMVNQWQAGQLQGTWAAMEEICKSGKAKAIGVSNYTIQHMEALLKYCTVRPAVLQAESHPHWPNRSLRDWCRKHDIAFQGYAPFGGQETPENSGHRPVDDVFLKKVAESNGLSNFQVCMQWNQSRNSSTVVQSQDKKHLRENLTACNVNLCSATDFKGIDEHAKEHTQYGPCYWGHNDKDNLNIWKDEEDIREAPGSCSPRPSWSSLVSEGQESGGDAERRLGTIGATRSTSTSEEGRQQMTALVKSQCREIARQHHGTWGKRPCRSWRTWRSGLQDVERRCWSCWWDCRIG